MTIDEEIRLAKEKHKKELDDLYRRKETLSKLDPEVIEVAEKLHKSLCTHNHTDGCGWFYNDDWSDYSRKRYYHMAREFLSFLSKETIIKILDILKIYR